MTTRVDLSRLTLGELGQRAAALRGEQLALLDRPERFGPRYDAELRADLSETNREIRKREKQRDQLRRLAADPARWESGGGVADLLPPVVEVREHVRSARTAIDRFVSRDELSDEAACFLEQATADDRTGATSRYIAAVSSESYKSAFRWLLQHGPESWTTSMSDRERAAVREVQEARLAQRALGEAAGATGGYALPFTLDPTLIRTSDSAINVLRRIARVIPTTTYLWKGVTSGPVTAEFVPEATEASDSSPTLGQPEIQPERAQSFVPYSIELGQDWGSIQAELTTLLQEAKDVLEAEKFLAGAGHGSNEPEGLLVGLASEQIQTAGSNALASGDVYAVKEALPPRYWANAEWIGSPTVGDKIRQFVGGGSQQPPLWEDGEPPQLLRKTFNEYPTMATTAHAGNVVLVYGDFQRFAIVDRLGMQIELIPHLFGSNHRPTGERGLFAYWRTSSAVLDPNGFRSLVVKS